MATFNEFARRFGILDAGHKVLLVFIPKAACSVLKATVIMNSPRREAYLASGKPIHDFVAEEREAGIDEPALTAPDVFRFIVLRNPATRMLSAYLSKFANRGKNEAPGITRDKTHAIQTAQALLGIPADLERSISFEEFVMFLGQARNSELNIHWMPQTRFVGSDLSQYQHVGCFERLDDTFDMLEQRFGYTAERDAAPHLMGSKNNRLRYNPEVKVSDAQRLLPAELRTLNQGYPPAECFLTPTLRQIIKTRFAEDTALHEQASKLPKTS